MATKGDQEDKALKEAIQIVQDARTELERVSTLQAFEAKLKRVEELLAAVQV